MEAQRDAKPITVEEWEVLRASQSVEYVVLNEHTLGYVDHRSAFMGVLHGSVLKGGHDWRSGSVPVQPGVDRLRQATRVDFEEYRVSVPSDFRDGSDLSGDLPLSRERVKG